MRRRVCGKGNISCRRVSTVDGCEIMPEILTGDFNGIPAGDTLTFPHYILDELILAALCARKTESKTFLSEGFSS